MVGVVGTIFAFDDGLRLAQFRGRLPDGFPGDAFAAFITGNAREGLKPAATGMFPAARLLRPGDFQRLLGLECRPWRIGNHADAVFQGHDLQDARNSARITIINLHRLCTIHRLTQDRAVDHARHLHVDAVLRRSIDLAGDIDPRHILADQAEMRLVERIELDVRRLRGHLGKSRDLAIRQTAARLRMLGKAWSADDFIQRHAPALRRIVEQHIAHLGTELAQVGEIARNGRTAGGVLQITECRIAVDLVVGRRCNNAHFRPVGIHFLGDDQRQRGQRTLAHLGRGRHDRHRAIGEHSDPVVELDAARRRLGHADSEVLQPRGRNSHPERQTGSTGHEATARGICQCRGFGLHLTPPLLQRVQSHGRCAHRCRSGRYWGSCIQRCPRAKASNFA